MNTWSISWVETINDGLTFVLVDGEGHSSVDKVIQSCSGPSPCYQRDWFFGPRGWWRLIVIRFDNLTSTPAMSIIIKRPHLLWNMSSKYWCWIGFFDGTIKPHQFAVMSKDMHAAAWQIFKLGPLLCNQLLVHLFLPLYIGKISNVNNCKSTTNYDRNSRWFCHLQKQKQE